MSLPIELDTIFNDLIIAKTLSLDGIEIVKNLKVECVKLSDQIETDARIIKKLSEDVKSYANKLENREKECSGLLNQLTAEKEAHEKLKLRENSIQRLELEAKFETKRGDEIKELFMAVVRNPIIRKQTITHQSGNVPIITKDSYGNQLRHSEHVFLETNDNTTEEIVE